MSRFYGSFSSDCTKDTSKRGHHFVEAHVRGWDTGIRCEVTECHVCGADKISAYETSGSIGKWHNKLIFEKCSANCQK